MTKTKIIAAGHICLDITPVFPQRQVTRVSELLQPGKLIETKQADVHTGGSVANTGIAMKLLGADVALKGKVGTDPFGEMVRSICDKYGAGKDLIVSDEDTTSYSVVLAIPGIDRMFLHNPGANHHFYASDISEEEFSEARHFHFGYPPLMRSMYEHDGAQLIQLFQKARLCGCTTSLDLAAVDPSSEAGQADWSSILKRVLPYVDFFVPSVEELCYMLDPAKYQELSVRAEGKDITEVITLSEVQDLGDQCIQMGAKFVMIKCGAPGMYYRSGSKACLQSVTDRLSLSIEEWADKEGFETSYVPEQILSGTGAGDTSIAAFLTAVMNGHSLEWCMHLAAAQGASCVAAYDALSGLKSLDELERKIRAGWKKNAGIGCLC